MTSMSSFRDLAATLRATVPSWVQRYNRKYQNDAIRRMNDVLRASGLSRKEVCERTGWKPGYLSRILSGGENLTLRTVARFEDAVGADVLAVTKAATPHRPLVHVAPARPLHASATVRTDFRPVHRAWFKGVGLVVVTNRSGVTVGSFSPTTSLN